jgi:hypothetical protein
MLSLPICEKCRGLKRKAGRRADGHQIYRCARCWIPQPPPPDHPVGARCENLQQDNSRSADESPEYIRRAA